MAGKEFKKLQAELHEKKQQALKNQEQNEELRHQLNNMKIAQANLQDEDVDDMGSLPAKSHVDLGTKQISVGEKRVGFNSEVFRR